MEYLYYSALFGLLYFYLGIGFALLASPLALRPYAWMLAPPVGYCYVLLAGWYCYRLELQGTDVYGPALLIPPGAMLLVAVFLRTTRKTTIAGTNLGDVLLPLGVAILGFTVLSIPSMSTPGLTAISEGHNNDIAQYSAVSRFLKEFARSDTLGFLGQAWEIKWLADDTVFGAFFSTALAASVIGRPTYQLQNIAMHVFFSYGCLLLYGLARRVFGHAMIGAASLTAVYALSPLTYYTMYQGFVSQIIAMSLMLALLLCYLSSVNDATTRTGEWRYLALAVLLTWGLSLTYPHMVPLIYGAVFVYTAVSGIARRDVRWFVRSTTFMLSTLFFTVLLSPGRAKALVDYFRFTGKVQAGWFVAFLWPDVVTGLTPLPDNVFLILGMNSIRALISVLVLAVAVIGIVAVYRADRDVAILAATLGGIIGCAYVLLAVLGRSPSGLGGFKGYKLLSFFLPVLLLCGTLMFRHAKWTLSCSRQTGVALMLSTLLLSDLYSAYQMVKHMRHGYRLVTKEMADLRRVEDDPRVNSVNLRDKDWWEVMWQVTFLMRKRLYPTTSTYYRASLPQGDWDLQRAVVGSNSEAIQLNDRYALTTARFPVRAQLGAGWYKPETTNRWTGAGPEPASVLVESAVDGLRVDLSTRYRPHSGSARLTITVNGEDHMECEQPDHCEATDVALRKGANVIEFRPYVPPAGAGDGNPPMASYRFSCLEVKPSSSSGAGARFLLIEGVGQRCR